MFAAVAGYPDPKDRGEWKTGEDFKSIWRRFPKNMSLDEYVEHVINHGFAELTKWEDKAHLCEFYKSNNLPAAKVLYLSQDKDFDVITPLKGLTSYCVKPTHHSNCQGVVLVKDGVYLVNVKVLCTEA